MRRATAIVLSFALASVTLPGASCGTSAPLPDISGVVLIGGATGPALEQLLAATPSPDTSKGVVIDAPANDTILPAAQVVTFRWHAPAVAARGVPLLLPAPRESPAPWLRDLLGPERAARADDAMSGAGYFLLFQTDEKPDVLRVFTTETSYTPDAAAWKTLSADMIWTQLSIASAVFQDDQLVPGEGPFEGNPVFFCIDKHPGADGD